MPLQGEVTVYIVCSEDDLCGGVAELSCLRAFPGARTCDILKISSSHIFNKRSSFSKFDQACSYSLGKNAGKYFCCRIFSDCFY